MDYSKIKLAAADMDGTLLNPYHELNPRFYSIYEGMKERGITLAIASGRQLYNMKNFFMPIKDDLIFIAENGSYTVRGDTEILVKPMDREQAREQIRFARQIPAAYIVLCGKKSAYVENSFEPFLSKMKLYYDKHVLVDDLMSVDDDQFLKIAICDFEGAERNSYPRFRDRENGLKITVSGEIWLDICHRDANKGNALKAIQEQLAIGKHETMVIGDYLNDLDMMDQAYYSFAMANAHPRLIEAARFTAGSNDKDGALDILERLAG